MKDQLSTVHLRNKKLEEESAALRRELRAARQALDERERHLGQLGATEDMLMEAQVGAVWCSM